VSGGEERREVVVARRRIACTSSSSSSSLLAIVSLSGGTEQDSIGIKIYISQEQNSKKIAKYRGGVEHEHRNKEKS